MSGRDLRSNRVARRTIDNSFPCEGKKAFSLLVKCVRLNIQYSVCALKCVFPVTVALQGVTVPELRAEVERFVLCYFNKV